MNGRTIRLALGGAAVAVLAACGAAQHPLGGREHAHAASACASGTAGKPGVHRTTSSARIVIAS